MPVLITTFTLKSRGPGKKNEKRQFCCDEKVVLTLEEEGEH